MAKCAGTVAWEWAREGGGGGKGEGWLAPYTTWILHNLEVGGAAVLQYL